MHLCFQFFNRALKSPRVTILLVATHDALPQAEGTPQGGCKILRLFMLALCDMLADGSRNTLDLMANFCSNFFVRIAGHIFFLVNCGRVHEVRFRREVVARWVAFEDQVALDATITQTLDCTTGACNGELVEVALVDLHAASLDTIALDQQCHVRIRSDLASVNFVLHRVFLAANRDRWTQVAWDSREGVSEALH